MFSCGVNEKSISDAIIDLFKQFYSNPDTEFTLYLSSTGGDIDSAIRFYDFVKATGMKINTVGFGQVDSVAVILFLSGQEKVLIDKCRIRLHTPTYNGPQQSQVISVHTETTALLLELDTRYFEILTRELPKIKNLREVFEKGKILSTGDALKLGFATKVEKELPIYK